MRDTCTVTKLCKMQACDSNLIVSVVPGLAVLWSFSGVNTAWFLSETLEGVAASKYGKLHKNLKVCRLQVVSSLVCSFCIACPCAR